VNNVVNQIQEVYADFQVINDDLFSLGVPSVLGLTKPITKWGINDQQAFNRLTEALLSLICATRANAPLIRFHKSSDLCYRLADKLASKLHEDSDGFFQRIGKNNPPESTTVLILDRREDPVTPLLNQWTYQAMIHEILEIKNNRVDLKHIENLEEEMKEVVLSSEDDRFYRKIMYKNFGEVAEDIHNLVQDFLKNKQSQAQFKSIEDMQRIIDNFPEFKKGERNTSKHFHILEELRKIVDGRNLYEVSEVEQDLVSGKENKQSHYKAVEQIINNASVSKLEKLRVAMLFALRYENDEKVFHVKE
jgi:vacuolar protein sorting-associated protein 45